MIKLLFVLGCTGAVQGFVFILSLAVCYITLDWSYLNPINWNEGWRASNALGLVATFIVSIVVAIGEDL